MTHFRLSRLLPRFLRGDKDKRFVDKNGEGSCTVLFLDDTELPISVKHTSKGQAILDKVYLHLNLHEKDYFGLRYVDQGGQTHWLDPNKSISSQLKACSLPFTFYFGVKFYAADPCKLREEITRYLFFLQVKRDILQGRLPVTFDEARELCAYAVQSELGDYDPNRYTPGYISEFRFLPNQTEDLEEELEILHKRLVGQVPAIAEYRYLEKVKWLEMYGVDLHPVLGEGSLEYFLGLTPTGIVVYKNKAKIGNYFWPRISKVTFKGKVFIIKVRDKNNDDHSYAFELQTKSACKHLWKCCVEHHAFFRLTRVPDGSNASKIFNLGSKHRYSGRTERQAQADQLTQSMSQNVLRVASRRQQRRINSDSRLNDPSKRNNNSMIDGGHVTMVMPPEQVRAPRHRSLPELQSGESPRSTRSAPWENNIDGGLYTSGKDSPISARSDKMLFPRHNRAVSGSDSESGVSNRRRYFPASRKGSDGESDASTTRRRRRGEGLDSGSESDISYRYALQNRRNRNHNDIELQNGHSDLPPMLFPFADSRKNGSIPSLHSAPGGDAKQRRRRRRSKSPGNKRPPEELKQHFEYDLIETEGMTEDQLKDIAFVSVETKAQPFRVKLSPRTRQKAKVNRHKSFGDTDQHSSNNRDFPPSVNNRHSNQSDFRTQSHTGLPNQNPDNNLPPSGSNSYSNNYRDGRPPSSYNQGQHVSRRNIDRENSASSDIRRNVSQQNSSSNVDRRDVNRRGDRNMRDSSYADNFDQSQSRSRDSANRHSYLSENQTENLETSQHSNYSKQSVRDNRYGNSRQNIPDSFHSNNSDNRHGNPNISRNSSYNTDKFNSAQNNSNPDRSRSRTGNLDQNNRLSKGDNFQSPEYAVPERSHARSSSQLAQPQQQQQPNNSRQRPQSAMYNSYPRNSGNPGNNNYNPQNNVSPRHARYTSPPSNFNNNNNNNNSQTNFNQPDRYSKHPVNRSSYPTSYNHHKPRPNPGSIGRETGRVLSNGKINNTDYIGQGRSPVVPYRQVNHPATPPRNPGTLPRNPITPPRHSGNQPPSNMASPAASDQSVTRSLGSSVNSEVMAHMMRASRFNSDLCTEL